MDEKLTNNHEDDIFNDLIRQKMEDFELPVDENIWRGIKQKLPKKEYKFFPWKTTLMVAAFLGGAGAILYYSLDEKLLCDYGKLGKNDNVKIEKVATCKKVHVENFAENIFTETIVESCENNIFAVNAGDEVLLAENIPACEATINRRVTGQTEPAIIAENLQVIETDITMAGETDTNLVEETGINLVIEADTNLVGEADIAMAEERDTNLVIEADTTQVASAEDINVVSEAEEQEDFNRWNISLKASFSSFPRELDGFPPVRISLLLRRNINRHFTVESGLVYSHLLTNHILVVSNGLNIPYTTTSLHYLGIPINAIVHILNKPRWNIYALAGAMAEKGLWQTTHYIAEDRKERSGIDGFQFSLRASAGLCYRLFNNRNWRVFAEPSLNFYFDNNQPKSIYTERRVNFGLSLGFRHEF